MIKEAVDEFGCTAGLKINPSKSHIFVGVADEQLKSTILQNTGFTEGKLPVRYLGLPLISTRLKDADCAPIIEGVRKKLNRWSNRALSYAGRLQLINSVLFHIQVYWSSACECTEED